MSSEHLKNDSQDVSRIKRAVWEWITLHFYKMWIIPLVISPFIFKRLNLLNISRANCH